MASPVVQVRVPEDLLARIDEHRGDVTRSAWILAACEAALSPHWPPSAVIAVPPGQYMGGVVAQADGTDAVPLAHMPGEHRAPVNRSRSRKTAKAEPPPARPVIVEGADGGKTIVMSANPEDRGRTIRPAAHCPHPKSRIIKGMCGACGTGGLA